MKYYSFRNLRAPAEIPAQLVLRGSKNRIIAQSKLLILVGPFRVAPLEARQNIIIDDETRRVLADANWENDVYALLGRQASTGHSVGGDKIWMLHVGATVEGIVVIYIEETEMEHSLPHWASCSVAELPSKLAKPYALEGINADAGFEEAIKESIVIELKQQLDAMLDVYQDDLRTVGPPMYTRDAAEIQRRLLRNFSILHQTVPLSAKQKDLIQDMRSFVNSEVSAMTNEILLELMISIQEEGYRSEARLRIEQQAVTVLTTVSILFLPAMLLLAFLGINTLPATAFGLDLVGVSPTIIAATLTFVLLVLGGISANIITQQYRKAMNKAQ